MNKSGKRPIHKPYYGVLPLSVPRRGSIIEISTASVWLVAVATSSVRFTNMAALPSKTYCMFVESAARFRKASYVNTLTLLDPQLA